MCATVAALWTAAPFACPVPPMPLSDLSESLRSALPSLSSLPDPMTVLNELKELAEDLAEDWSEGSGAGSASTQSLAHAHSLNDFSMGAAASLQDELDAHARHTVLLQQDPDKLRKLYNVLKTAQKGLHKAPGSSFEQRFLELEAAVKALEEAEHAAAEAADQAPQSKSAPGPSLLPKAAQLAGNRRVSVRVCTRFCVCVLTHLLLSVLRRKAAVT